MLATFDRAQLEGFVAVAIDLMDLSDGDADVEAAGDELDGTNAEDVVGNVTMDPWQHGPGCPISDADYGAEEPGEQEGC